MYDYEYDNKIGFVLLVLWLEVVLMLSTVDTRKYAQLEHQTVIHIPNRLECERCQSSLSQIEASKSLKLTNAIRLRGATQFSIQFISHYDLTTESKFSDSISGFRKCQMLKKQTVVMEK